MPARRALAAVYARAVRDMDKKERRKFDGQLDMTLEDLRETKARERRRVRGIFALEGEIA